MNGTFTYRSFEGEENNGCRTIGFVDLYLALSGEGRFVKVNGYAVRQFNDGGIILNAPQREGKDEKFYNIVNVDPITFKELTENVKAHIAQLRKNAKKEKVAA